jgi:integrase
VDQSADDTVMPLLSDGCVKGASMNIKIWKPGQKGNPSDRQYYFQFFQRKNRYRGVLEARNAEQAKLEAQRIWDEEWNKHNNPAPEQEPEANPVRMFSEFVKETYLPWSESHKASYGDDVRITTMLTDFFKDKTLTEIKPVLIEQFKAQRRKADKALATINRELSVLSKIFTVAIRLEEAESNPCQNVERFTLDNQRVRYLTEEEEDRLFEAMGDDGLLKDVVTVALHTGMRRGEIFGLKWFDLDFERGVLQVRKTKTKLNRTVPMNARVREVLAQRPKSSVHVFTSPRTRCRLVDLKKGFNEARSAAGIPDFQLRDLRHSCATRMSDCGEELVTIAEILGHTDIRMTKRYSHAMHERKRQALEKLAVTSNLRQIENGRVRALP